MPTNKNASIRYLALDACFSNIRKRFYIEDLIEACNYALYEYVGEGSGVKRRQIFDDITFMESDQGYAIPLERIKDGRRVYYRYGDPDFSIQKKAITEGEMEELRGAIDLLSRFQGLPQYTWLDELNVRLQGLTGDKNVEKPVVEFEQNPYLKGLHYFSVLYQAIQKKRCLSITYQGFKKTQSDHFEFHPYFLKQYNSRWFVFGQHQTLNQISNLALDRITELEETKTPFLDNDLVDFSEYFEDIVGVTVDTGAKVEDVRLLITPELWPYVETKPIHGSMRVMARSEEGIEVRLDVKINYELVSRLFALGEGIKIIKPLSLKNSILEKAKELILNNK
ncbi:MAG TPA: WYL domain-containing protein [Bacteroidales bacterium]|nr:WYL domain-containing protein [Bacteroidales bacterium]